MRDTDQAPPACIACSDPRASERVLEQADDARRSLDVAVELVEQLQLGQARRQRLRIEIGRDQDEGVVMRRRFGGVQGPR